MMICTLFTLLHITHIVAHSDNMYHLLNIKNTSIMPIYMCLRGLVTNMMSIKERNIEYRNYAVHVINDLIEMTKA